MEYTCNEWLILRNICRLPLNIHMFDFHSFSVIIILFIPININYYLHQYPLYISNNTKVSK